ncbi:kinase-like domain-containing protein [Boletus reticuloceps]|uniref:Kinase-like domain-containing protein n=1 Tax=Boletus reticuloceps TaxID=495285 RepID=A0A8I3A586_9AGAM|nr:kinase-like domain-containing protein [Boletus reticuloceps]
MSSQMLHSQLESRPLVDLTDQVVRDSAIQIAGGAFGDVYKCRLYTSGSSSLVAVKSLRYFVSEDPEENQRKLESNNKILRREMGLLRRLEHSNIVPLLGVTHGFGPILAAVLPWMANGTLHSFLKNKGQMLSIVERLKMVHGIGSGLEHLHLLSVFHGDLHSGNVLVDEEQNPRIGDFGLSCTIGKLQPGLSYLQRLSSASNVGAVRWAAPERLSGCKPHPSGDIYSFGCIMFEVLSGDIPWNDKTTYQVVALKLHAHQPPSRPIHTAVEDEHWTLMVRCWSSPQRRPSAREAVIVVQTFSSSAP